ncbi:carbamoyltransferase HypF [Dongshaea marina]|uniref:carbamoyltransferase HypF n=1 Tax=Dongshaea marina TaxID=2047966 RepID=UPI00131ED5B0|nr:carbamoyltransferase HypF [Dongshaea marina]
MSEVSETICQLHLDVTGVVQGVGFRPAVYRLAVEAGLSGMVQNAGGKVRIIIEGLPASLEQFKLRLPQDILRYATQASIDTLEANWHPAAQLRGFVIEESTSTQQMEVAIPADLVSCPECQAEFMDPDSRRYLYPFTTCTACGPRYTVVESMPYDRQTTTLRAFPLCSACEQEYTDPLDRRFHAESTACPECGPSLSLFDENWQALPGSAQQLIAHTHRALRSGKVVAVRGMGGYLLCVDARNPQAIDRLRASKCRPDKPFALMARDLDTLRRQCQVSEQELALLTSSTGPICILQTQPNSDLPLEQISPDSSRLGVMLPTTPLHQLLLGVLSPEFDFLVATSGNRAGEPICRDDQEAHKRLTGVADLFLTHDRDLARVCDDSLFIQVADKMRVMRRARGIAPSPVTLHRPLERRVLAMGGDLKNTLCLGYANKAILSPHIGELSYLETAKAQQQMARILPEFLQQAPEVIAIDAHPDYLSSSYGEKLARELGVELVEVQHHYAHAAACMAEHQLDEALAVVFDGLGYGADGTLWGGEFLHLDPSGYRRLGALQATSLIGGDRATREPLRQLLNRLLELDLCDSELTAARFSEYQAFIEPTRQLLKAGEGTESSSCGRLFDAVAALLGGLNSRSVMRGRQPFAWSN